MKGIHISFDSSGVIVAIVTETWNCDEEAIALADPRVIKIFKTLE